jgi:hypothetical protein
VGTGISDVYKVNGTQEEKNIGSILNTLKRK